MEFIEITDNNPNYEILKDNIHQYFINSLRNEEVDIILALSNEEVVGTGIIFYYNSVPSAMNLTGKNAYITSMYVKETHRNNGIGSQILKQLISLAADRKYPVIMLNSSDMGRPLYQKLGFTNIENGMILKLS